MATVTNVNEANYALAESQAIFDSYRKKICAATGDDHRGMGVFMHLRTASDPKDTTIMRANYDTFYSFAILDLRECPATLVMPPRKRYQSAWLVDEEHYNPFAVNEPGSFAIDENGVGNRFVMIIVRTQVNMRDEADVKAATLLQDQLELKQENKGEAYAPGAWDTAEVLAMRAKYQKIVEEKNLKASTFFGKKGSISLLHHNCGTAFGWGGLTEEQVVYLPYTPSGPPSDCSLNLRDVPVKAFWSVTVYDADGNVNTERYNINSAFAVPNEDKSFTIHFGLGEGEGRPNFMDIREGWNFTLRLYLPTEVYFQGAWPLPELTVTEG